MKISKEQKLETQRKLINAAADLFVLHGFDKTSMKQIAREAGVGDATIYKYFANKDKLILGFYDTRGADALAEYRATDGLETFTFAEKVQLLIDTFLEQLMADREFVELSLKQILKSPITLLKDELAVAQGFKAEFTELLADLQANPDYPDIPMQGTLASLLTDYVFGMTLYWMKDDSKAFTNTTQLTDLSIGIIDSVLQSGFINKAFDMFGFIIKTHLLRGLSHGGGVLNMMQEFKSAMAEHKQTAE